MFFQEKRQVRSILGDAKLNIATFQARPISLFVTIPYHQMEKHTLHRKHVALVRMQFYSERLVGLSCENLSGVCTDYTDYWVMRCVRAAEGASV